MSIINIGDNEKIYEREKQKTKTERNKGVMQAIGKV